MAEIAFGLAETVLEKLASKAFEEIGLAKSAKDNLRKLKDTVLILRSKLNDAEKKQKQNEELRVWIRKLKDVFNDAVDVLDEFDCEALKRQVAKEFGSVSTKVRRFCSRSNPIVFRFSIAHKVKEINERLDEVTSEMARFQLISSQISDHEELSHLRDRERSNRMTHSFVKVSDVIGRDEDKAKIIDMLMSQDECDGDKNLSLVPIVGFGGLGKTTLAKSVFNDEKVQKRFGLKIWVCVSLDFDVASLLREILKSANYTAHDPSSLSLEQLQTSVRRVFEGKRFLLVLDDVWSDDRAKWLELRQFLMGGVEGSKVIVTTRSTTVSSAMTKTPPYKLQGLSQEDSLSLFFRCSFGEEKREGQHQRFKEIGKDIVRKCGGVPLALMTLGSLLFQKSEAEWISLRDNKIWEIEKEEDRILSVLRLSYNALSPCKKQCFAHWSTFHEDEKVRGIDLILVWMALGFLQSPIGKLEPEDVGLLLINELCDRSLIQLTVDYSDILWEIWGSLGDTYVMHDLIHNLARSITQEEYCVVNSEKEDIHESVRNLRLSHNQNSLPTLQKLKKLRSIHISHTTTEFDLSESFMSLCIKQSRHLRVFDLGASSFKVLPSSVGTLSHLRYLNLSRNIRIKRLPNSICNLQSLQTLNLYRCEELEELPKDLRKLVSLRVFIVTTKQTLFPENGIGRLKSLQMMFIRMCRNVRSLPRDIINCATLRHLDISACYMLDLASTDDAIVPLSLQTLIIRSLRETTALPQWLKGASGSLKKLHIEHCHKLAALPVWLQYFTSLETFEIIDCVDLELASIYEGQVRLKLTRFIISRLPSTSALPSWLQGASDTLEVLKIDECSKLASLEEWQQNMVSLKELVIQECRELSTLPKGMTHMVSLEKLVIQSCHKLSTFPEGMQRLTSLTELCIQYCDKLKLPSETYQGIPMSLKNVSIGLEEMADLPQWLQGASHTLESLHFIGCVNLYALPEWLTGFTSLKKLDFYRCVKLSTLPEGMSRLTSLIQLKIRYCDSAFQKRYVHEIGDDWKSIAHVPNVVIEGPTN